ncbi:MAG: hypothetical protein ABIR32_20900 [Ilumatobacteraceae bacterium]
MITAHSCGGASHVRRLASAAIVAVAITACGGSDGATSVKSSTDHPTTAPVSSISSPDASITPTTDAGPSADAGVVSPSTAPIASPTTTGTGAGTAVCFPVGSITDAVDLSDAFFSANGCTFTAQGDGDAFWTSVGYRRVDLPGATYVNESLRCAVNSGISGAEPGTTRWSVLCGNAYPLDAIDANPTTIEPPAPASEDLAIELWPAGLSLPDSYAFTRVQDYPERSFTDFTITYSGDGIARDTFWTWAAANLDGVSADETDGEQDVSYHGRHIEIFQMGDASFRLLLAK